MITQPNQNSQSSKKILIADDDTGLLEAMSCRLEAAGYTVFTTQDGYQALAIARRELPDLLILDINMPAGSGLSVLERVRVMDTLEQTPVIFITGQEPGSVTLPDQHSGHEILIHKPFDTGTLMATINECLDPRGSPNPSVYVL